MSRLWVSDLIGVFKGAQSVTTEVMKYQEECIKHTLQNSSLKSCAEKCVKGASKQLDNISPSKVPGQTIAQVNEMANRLSVVGKGVEEFIKLKASETLGVSVERSNSDRKSNQLYVYNLAKDPRDIKANSYSLNLKNESNYNPQSKMEECYKEMTEKKYASVKEKIETLSASDAEIPKIVLSAKEKEILRKLELEHDKKLKSQIVNDTMPASISRTVAQGVTKAEGNSDPEHLSKQMLKPSVRPKQTLSPTAKAQKVPSTRLQRVISFGTLGVGLGIGTLAEYTRRTLGLTRQPVGDTLDNMFLSEANVERIVSTLCKVRGAALKLGQIISIQDDATVSPELQKAFERVRQSADFMPKWQVEKVLANELGSDWRTKLAIFEDKPFAAASIGQVHYASLLNGQNVGIKIQYPGVARGIQSDIENLVTILKAWNVFPKGLFIDNLVDVAKRELAWEVDYVREAECTRKYKKLVEPYPEYHVPKVIDDLSTKQVFTTELVDGVPVDKCISMDVEMKQYICKLMMRLCLKELFVFRYMQTDPNWSNFFYNPATKQLVLLDFGACRSYDKTFMDKYIQVIHAASEGDRATILQLSTEMGFLTGYESKIMKETHVDAVMVLGQVFDKNRDYYDFSGQDVTKRIQALVPTILDHRLCPPPEEIYSLHRKLSGIFLLCAKLGVKINCRDLFQEVYADYKFG